MPKFDFQSQFSKLQNHLFLLLFLVGFHMYLPLLDHKSCSAHSSSPIGILNFYN